MASSGRSTSIPLHCNVCPGSKQFSDVSHLLTHIASKGHLSHHFNVGLKSSTDDAARQKLATYDNWYASHGIAELLSERMEQKNKKTARSRKSTQKAGLPNGSRPHASRQTSFSQASVSSIADDEDALDPLLSQDNDGHHSGITTTHCSADDGQARLSRFQGPPMTPPRTRRPSRRSTEARLALTAGDMDESNSGSDYDEPDNDSNPPSEDYPDPSIASNPQGVDKRPSQVSQFMTTNTTPTEDPEDNFNGVDETAECAERLKGVLWLGMDIFDSATPDTRRKRNQRKDDSVMAQMETNSGIVEATELVFTPKGALKRTQPITGNVESSPLQESTPVFKTRKHQKKTALAVADKNRRNKSISSLPAQGRGKRTNTAKATIKQVVKVPADPPAKSVAKPPATHHAELIGGLESSPASKSQHSQRPSDQTMDEDEEFGIALDIFRQRNSRGFQVFNDGASDQTHGLPLPYQNSALSYEGQRQYGYGYTPFGGMHGLSLLNSSFQPLFADGSVRMSATRTERTQPARQASEYGTIRSSLRREKENIEPIMYNKGRIEDHNRLGGKHNLLAPSQNGPAPQGLASFSGYPDFGMNFLGLPHSQGLTSNPLNASFHQPHFQQPCFPPTTNAGLGIFISPHRVMKNPSRPEESPSTMSKATIDGDNGVLYEGGDE